ncbi:MAG: 2TM domain-containing protein [Aquabacterium sp.]
MDYDEQDPVVRKAHRRVKLKLGFLTHLTVFVLVNAGLWFIAQTTGGGWSKFPLWGWGLGLAIHGIVTLVALEGDGIRERMLRDEVDALRRKQP